MKLHMNKGLRSAIVAACASSMMVLTACGTVSDVTSEGTTQNPVFPAADRVGLNNDQGTFPNPASLAQVGPGMTKDQLYHLLGRPHFSEGMFGVREWDYVFHFHTPGAGVNGVTTCQFKVLYDKDVLTRSFFWKPVSPENAPCPPGAAPAKTFTLDADGLFRFDRADLDGLHPAGRKKLDALVASVKQADQLRGVSVVGHTDRLGSESYNRQLSRDRAATVATYLANGGIARNLITSTGVGESQPVVQCTNADRAQLIACLAPNRRVDVIVDGSGQVH